MPEKRSIGEDASKLSPQELQDRLAMLKTMEESARNHGRILEARRHQLAIEALSSSVQHGVPVVIYLASPVTDVTIVFGEFIPGETDKAIELVYKKPRRFG